MDLKQIIDDHWGKCEFMSLAAKKDLRELIISQTSFLDKYYSNISLRSRSYCIKNNITEETIPRCKCGNVVSLNKSNPEKGFRIYCSPQCHHSDYKIDEDALEKLQSYEWLYHQRITLQKAIETIGNELSVSTGPVYHWLEVHGLKNLSDSRQRNVASAKILQNKEKLEELYNQGLTCEKIAESLNTTKGTISRWLNKHQIEVRESNSYDNVFNRVSKEEQSLVDFISSVYSGEIKTSVRSILKGKEIDIYIPEFNFAIEYNGLYSHSYKPWEDKPSLIKGPKYHLEKTVLCENQGIQLFQLFSDEWILRRTIVESMVRNKLKLNKTIYARKCQIVNVDVDTKNRFLRENHLQGEDKSKFKLGLVYEDELVSLMTFNKSRFNVNCNWELTRFCTKLNYNVVGGFSKLLKYFRDNYDGSIVSYADRRYSMGDLYLKTGFRLERVNGPSYYYVDKNYIQRFNRMRFQKKLIGAVDCTEYERAREMGYNKIYDCGTITFILD